MDVIDYQDESIFDGEYFNIHSVFISKPYAPFAITSIKPSTKAMNTGPNHNNSVEFQKSILRDKSHSQIFNDEKNLNEWK